MQETQIIINDLKILKKYFDDARIVDPLYKRIYKIKEGSGGEFIEEEKHEVCYDFWGISHNCLNCISMRAIIEKDTFVKFEEVAGKVFMVSAMPVNINNQLFAIELLKDVTHQKLLDGALNIEFEKIDNATLRSSIARLNELVTLDALTQIYNRKYINEKLPVTLIEAYRDKAYLSIAMVDIDHFKRVNDSYGHVVGDEILQQFAQTLKKNIRQGNGDWVARYGGEEFLLCLNNSNKQDAWDTSERIRQVVEKEKYSTSAGIITITASFGVQTICNQKIDMFEFIQRADKNLYTAKQAGRNRSIAQ